MHFLAKAPQMGIRKMAITPGRTVAHRWDWSQINSEIEAVSEKELREKMISVYGGVKLDKQEKMFLSLGPEFTVLDKLDYTKIKGEFQIALTKIRWARMGKEPEEVNREISDKEIEEEDERV